MLYLIWSNEHNSWWRENSLGYTGNINEAGRYSYFEALDICNQANYGWDTGRLKSLPNELPIAEDIAINLKNTRT